MDSDFVNEKLEKSKVYYDDISYITEILANISVLKGFPQSFEKEFKDHFFQKNLYSLRLILFFGLLLYSSYALIDIYTIPNWQAITTIRLYVTTPILIGLFFLCFTRLYRYFYQLISVLFALVIIVGLTSAAVIAPPPYKDLFYQSLCLVAFFLAILTALQFKYTLFICVSILFAFNISYYFSGMDKTPYYAWGLFGNNYIIGGAMIVCASVSYFNEINLRKQFLLTELNKFKSKLLEFISRTDEVTGLGNRHQLEEVLPEEWGRALRYQYSLALIFADFDYFKQYNDKYGHQAGDKALRNIGLAFSTCLKRAGDFVFRYGGDEFVAIISNTNLSETIRITKNIMQEIKQLAIQHEASPISNIITVTMGISIIIPDNENLQKTLVNKADIALQKGKLVKRGNIYIHTENGIINVDELPDDLLDVDTN